MGFTLATHPSLPQHTQTVTLDGTQFRLRLTWRHRLRGWYLDLYALDETPLLLARRLCPGWSLNLGLTIEGGPEGVLLVTGPDDYERGDLGGALLLWYYPRAELQAVYVAPEVLTTVEIA